MKKQQGMKLKEIAERCGYQPAMITNMMKKGKEPSIISIEKIAKGFNLDISFFLEEEKDKNRFIPTPMQEELLKLIGDDDQLLKTVIELTKKEKLYLEATRDK